MQMKWYHLLSLSVAAAILSGLALADAAHAQRYPAKPVKIIVPLAAGGLADILARTVAQAMGESSGQTVVVENRPGGAGAIAAEAAARSPAKANLEVERAGGRKMRV